MFEFLIIAAIAIGAIISICKAIEEHKQRQEQEKLKHTHPEVYAQLKQMEHEQKMMAHDEKRMRHDKVKTGVGIGTAIFRALFK